jgi:hypothetical protein
LISRLPSHSSSPPLYSIPRTPLVFLPLFSVQASLTQCVSALNFGLISVYPNLKGKLYACKITMLSVLALASMRMIVCVRATAVSILESTYLFSRSV